MTFIELSANRDFRARAWFLLAPALSIDKVATEFGPLSASLWGYKTLVYRGSFISLEDDSILTISRKLSPIQESDYPGSSFRSSLFSWNGFLVCPIGFLWMSKESEAVSHPASLV